MALVSNPQLPSFTIFFNSFYINKGPFKCYVTPLGVEGVSSFSKQAL